MLCTICALDAQREGRFRKGAIRTCFLDNTGLNEEVREGLVVDRAVRQRADT